MIFRAARHTNDLNKIETFYTEILGFEKLGSFGGHNKYDGLFVGFRNSDWHLEFTQSTTKAVHDFDEDDILVFYPESNEEYNLILNSIDTNDIAKYKPVNTYWQQNGIMISDPDGYRIIISNQKIKK